MNFNITVPVPVTQLKAFYDEALSTPEAAASLVEQADDLRCVLGLKMYLSMLRHLDDAVICNVDLATLCLIDQFKKRLKASKAEEN